MRLWFKWFSGYLSWKTRQKSLQKIAHHYSFQDETWPTFSNLFLWFATIAIFPQPVQLVCYLFYLGPWERMMQRKREEQNEIGKSYKNGPQGRASVYLYQPTSAVYPSLWGSRDNRNGWIEWGIIGMCWAAGRQLFS